MELKRRPDPKIGASEYLTSLYKNGPKRSIIEDPEISSNSRVLVIAPHHDDAIIGCGGTLAKLAKRGAHIKVLFMTDTCYESCLGPSSILMPMNNKEVEESLAAIRCYECEHLDLPCFNMRCDNESKRALFRVIDYYSPDIVVLPWIQDHQPDNKMTGLLAAHALRKYEGRLTLYSYEVWGGLFPNTMVEITETMEEKISAAKVRRSYIPAEQVEQRLREDNVYRKSSMQPDRYGEPFLRLERIEFMKMHERIGVFERVTA
jgi:N-acetylglucosamine malate deacetylase 1